MGRYLNIAGSNVGEDYPVFVVAEIGIIMTET